MVFKQKNSELLPTALRIGRKFPTLGSDEVGFTNLG